MPKTIQIRDVNEDTHRVLRMRAAEAGLSLSEYLRQELDQMASRPTVAEVLARAARRPGGATREQILEALHAGREERQAQLDRS